MIQETGAILSQGWAPCSFTSERIVLLRSFKERNVLLRSFTFFFRVFGDLRDPKEQCVLLHSFLKNLK